MFNYITYRVNNVNVLAQWTIVVTNLVITLVLWTLITLAIPFQALNKLRVLSLKKIFLNFVLLLVYMLVPVMTEKKY